MTIIEIPENTKYISEVISDFPANCIFDKGRVGAGCTTIALTNTENYIIAVPFISLIENKLAQYPDNTLLGVTGNTISSKVKKYLKNTEIKKILVTYDSLPRLIEQIEEFGYSTQDFSLLIDEYHLLFTQYSFRRDAVKGLLDSYQNFKKYCFVTATILQEEFILDELKYLPIVTAKWSTVKEVSVKSVRCQKDVIKTVVHLINRFLNDEIEGNAYIFVNSVEFIKDLIQLCDLTDENTRAIWSKNNKTQVNLKRGTTIDPPKKINLLTSTVFEGSDIYDEDGKIYIISDKTKSHTLVDISTSFQQIAGRIRNTKYWNQITHIYSNTRYNVDVKYHEFKSFTDQTIKDAIHMIGQYNALDDLSKKGIKEVANEYYIDKVGDEFIFDPNLVKIDLYNFKITKCIYKLRVNVQKELASYGYSVEEEEMESEVINLDDLGNRFEEYITNLKEIYNSQKVDDLNMVEFILNKYDWLKPLISKIGYEKSFELFEQEKFNTTNIKRKAINFQDSEQDKKVVEQLLTYPEIAIGTFIPAAKAKEILKNIYSSLDINKTAKGSDLDIYFVAKNVSKSIKNKMVKGYIPLQRKY
jgi:hypothetical protein